MKASRILATALTLATLLASVEPASAKSKSRGRGPSRPKAIVVHASTDDTIESVTSNSITIKNSQTKKTFEIDGNTEILVDRRRAGRSDLSAGMRVVVRGSTLNPHIAQYISVDDSKARAPKRAVTTKSTDPKKPAKKAQGKKKKK